jgi:selenocysteine lyase/cysteine desulfurase
MTDTAASLPAIQTPARLGDPDWDGGAVEALRAREYSRLDALGHVYLDYTGGSLYAESQVRQHHDLLRRGVFGNPHSENPTSLAATRLADRAREVILAYLRADHDEYTVVFTPNASGALKHVAESYPFTDRSQLLLTYDNHNSVNGIREFARRAGAEVAYLPLGPDLRQDPQAVLEALGRPPNGGPRLFAYPAQSNYSGVRHPLEWVTEARTRGWDIMLDASAFVPTNALDLSRWHPDFVSLSWYKVFGYPTGIGSLVARRQALARLRRPWFSGGTIGVASVVEPRHTLAPNETGFEDGTIDYLGLPGIEIGIRHIESIGVETIHRRVQYLTRRLLEGLVGLRHRDGGPLIRLYGPSDDRDRGGTVPFNVLDPSGRIVGFWEVEARAAERRISLRTGCFCNPGASETARGITAPDMRRIFGLGRQPTVEDLCGLLPGKALGAVRASVGIASTERDVDALIEFLADFPNRARMSAIRPLFPTPADEVHGQS